MSLGLASRDKVDRFIGLTPVCHEVIEREKSRVTGFYQQSADDYRWFY